MKLSVSARIAEGFLSKKEAIMTLPELADLAVAAGFEGLCMRASQIGIHTPREAVEMATETVRSRNLQVTMISGDFNIVYNNDDGPNCLRNITAYLDLAEALGAPLIRVCIKTPDDIATAQNAADEAAERGLKLVHQCHVQSLFETVNEISTQLTAINRPNFGLIFEAANLEECRQEYGSDTIRRFGDKIFNVYLQNQLLKPDGAVTLDTWNHGPISFDIIPIPNTHGIDFPRVFEGLHAINYRGAVTVHQSAPEDGSSPADAARETADYLRNLI
ncbi:MAG: sugar phosphate isomerase/epimerase family protein [Limisphaerales bacterium]